MAKPPQAGRYDQKKAEPLKDVGHEVEEEGPEKEANESAQENQQQNAIGNSAIQNQVMGTDASDPSGGGGGGGGLSMRKAGQESDKGYGGDGDGDPDAPMTLEDLTRSWNPGTNKTEDRPSWLEPMPSDELPPEDPEFLALVKDAGPLRVEPGFTLDARLQPSTAVVAASLLDWSRGVMRWVEPSLLNRTIGHTLVPPTSFIQDPHGRLLITRARTGAIGSLLLLDCPVFRQEPPPTTVAFVQYMLELEGHRRHAEEVRIDPGVEGKQMPKTGTVFDRAFEGRPNAVQPADLPPTATGRLDALLAHLLDMEDPSVYIPSMILEYQEEEDDPLGLDAVLFEFTGGKKDENGPLFYAAIQAAEKLAAATARTRVHVAGTAVAMAQVARMFSAGPPIDTLQHVCATVDRDTDRNLRLLVEIARAAQRRSVPPKGLKAGLLRAAKALRGTLALTGKLLRQISGGILPGDPMVPAPFPAASDPMEEAWLDGNPIHAMPWVSSLPSGPEMDVVRLLMKGAIRVEPRQLAQPLLDAADHLSRPHIAEVIRIYAAPCLLAAGETEAVIALGERHIAMGIERRNGMLLAHGSVLKMEALWEAGQPELAAAARLEGGRTAWRIGAPGGLSILARWRPPSAT